MNSRLHSMIFVTTADFPGLIHVPLASEARPQDPGRNSIFRILRNTECEKKTAPKTPFKRQVFCRTNVFSSSLCEAGAITGSTSKPFCAPQLGAHSREALYILTCITYNTETINVSNKEATHSFTSLAQVCGQMEGSGRGGRWAE